MSPGAIESIVATRSGETVIASPFVEERWAARVLGKLPAETGTADLIGVAQELGCELLYFAEGGVDFNRALGDRTHDILRTVVLERGAGWERTQTTLRTPVGELTSIAIDDRRPEDPVLAMLSSYMKEEKDYRTFNWYLDRLESGIEDLVKQKREYVSSKVRDVGGAGLVCSDGPVSFNLLGWLRRDDQILQRMDFPKTYLAAVGRLHGIEQILMVAALDSGARVFRFCVEGRERFTRETFQTDVLPFLAEDLAILHARGAFSYIHTCGHMKEQLCWGYLNELKPHLVESFTAHPEGDIDDLRWAREALDARICTRGNVSLTLLRNGPPRRIADDVGKIVEAVRGYRHIVSGTDAVHAGTPFENVAALVQATNDRNA